MLQPHPLATTPLVPPPAAPGTSAAPVNTLTADADTGGAFDGILKFANKNTAVTLGALQAGGSFLSGAFATTPARRRRADRHQAGPAGAQHGRAAAHRGGSVETRYWPGGPVDGGARLDTRNPTSKLMLTILAGVATWEREIMLERQREGIAKAKAAGKYKGRPISIDAAQIRQLRAELGPAAIAKRLGIARSSVYRALA